LFRLNGQLVRLDPARLTAAEADQVGLTAGRRGPWLDARSGR